VGCQSVRVKVTLNDLGLHYPPCRKLAGNRGFYALDALAWTLGVVVDAIGGQSRECGNSTRRDGRTRQRPTPKRMRLWRLRRELFAFREENRDTCSDLHLQPARG
jgi:hypothetical protein